MYLLNQPHEIIGLSDCLSEAVSVAKNLEHVVKQSHDVTSMAHPLLSTQKVFQLAVSKPKRYKATHSELSNHWQVRSDANCSHRQTAVPTEGLFSRMPQVLSARPYRR